MPTELEELIEFLGSPRPEIRQLALEYAQGYSQGLQSDIFLHPDLKPIKDLKVIVNDIAPRAKIALAILINLCDKASVISNLEADDAFLELLLSKITDKSYPNADLCAMLLANMTKSDKLARLIDLKRAVPEGVSTSEYAMDQLMDCFVKGAEKKLNPEATYDYLSYVMADLSRLPSGRQYFITRRDYDDVIPVSKLVVFTEHKSNIRRKGVASTIKNCCFDTASHKTFLEENEVNLLPYLLLPLMGPEEYDDDDTDGMPLEIQLLPPDKERDTDMHILVTHLESLLLLTSTRAGREFMRKSKVYPIIRETHMNVEDDDVRDACDRIVQVLMPEVDNADDVHFGQEAHEEEDDNDDEIMEIL
ncbi:hypothetical protein FPQ18DRAFT_399927 [Pyronema domesticum]|uniref:Protein HGH1 homolog n=1 Tax=Pyronema omphalodes (strain CBS 100304) TaxID=1076935 RepID=U4LLE6_PYROM|nr:hypothetical protein FPQ18DRAFT_399927 [Pyronema domesticum]CCX32753.1 Similar to FAM203 family protein C1020.12c; acc. no. Q10498 [Pyronema omphalodes CBS 100304]